MIGSTCAIKGHSENWGGFVRVTLGKESDGGHEGGERTVGEAGMGADA